MSREQRRLERGLCAKCSRKRTKSKRLCDAHLAMDSERKRIRGGFNLWHKGSRGRPPLGGTYENAKA